MNSTEDGSSAAVSPAAIAVEFSVLKFSTKALNDSTSSSLLMDRDGV
jgi:hypothetical protein